MLTREQVIAAVRAGRTSAALDGRDYSRLVEFFPVEDWELFGFKLKEGAKATEPRAWTEEEVKKQLAKDLDFAFDKALGQRGISASLMYEVVKMWMWVLENPLQYFDDYAQYGLPLFKAVALEFGLENQIGDDEGDEYKYSSEA